jgi:hypothetical protein
MQARLVRLKIVSRFRINREAALGESPPSGLLALGEAQYIAYTAAA